MLLRESHWIIANYNLIGQIITSATLGGLFFIALFYYYFVDRHIFAKQLLFVFSSLLISVLIDIFALISMLETGSQSIHQYYTILAYMSDVIVLYIIHQASMRIWLHNHTKLLFALGVFGMLIEFQVVLFPDNTLLLAVYAIICLTIAQYYHIIDRDKIRLSALLVISVLFTGITIYFIYIYGTEANVQSTLYKHEWFFILIFLYTLLFYIFINYRYLLKRKDLLNDQLIRDSLTGLFAKVYFNEHIESIDDGWILFIDVNNFKWINDTLGHNYGDDTLRNFGNYLKSIESDKILSARYGGDEFAISLSQMPRQKAHFLAKNMCSHFGEAIDKVVHTYNQNTHRLMIEPADVGISIGIAKLSDGDYKAALLSADEQMYLAKSKGNYVIQEDDSKEVSQ